MTIYNYSDYRSYLNAFCQAENAPRGLRAALAREAGCQASYLSQVLKGRVHLTEDQLLGIASHLELSAAETEHMLLMLRFEKAGTAKLKTHLQKAITLSQREQMNLKNRIVADELTQDHEALGIYFSSWIPSAVHLLTSSSHTQTIDSISARLNIPTAKTKETLIFLERFGFIERQDQRWVHGKRSLHIPKNSAFQIAAQTTRRELAARSIALNPADAFHFSSVFTIDELDLKELKELFAKLVEKSHKIIQKSGTNRLACVCMDLFEVV